MTTPDYKPDWKRAYGMVVRELREQLGLSRADLERRASLSKGYVTKLEDQGIPEKPGGGKYRPIAQVLQISPEDLYIRFEQKQSELKGKETSPITYMDWGEAPDIPIFYGRTEELTTIEQWATLARCRLITLLGMGGIGKTALSVKLVQKLAENSSNFQYIIWRSLREAPSVEKILTDLIKFLSNQENINLADTVDGKITQLIEYLRLSRCLIVLDNAESILQSGSLAGHYRENYQDYGSLLKRVSEASHLSCLLITSREKPANLSPLESPLVRALRLKGLSTEAEKILEIQKLSASRTQMLSLVELYSGNPLALKIVASLIRELFNSDVEAFLSKNIVIFNGIRVLLDEQFNRSSKLEQSLMYWLAINREPVSIDELQEDLVPSPPLPKLIDSLEHLKWRSLVERTQLGFTLQNVVMEYVTDQLLERVSLEISRRQFDLFNSHTLFKASVKDYIKESQTRLILQSLQIRLLDIFKTYRELEINLKQILLVLQENSTWRHGYGAGNVLSLLCYLEVDLKGYDFSHLTIRQACLQATNLQTVDFSYSEFIRSVFTDTFGHILSITFSQDGTLFATGDTNNEIHVWEVISGRKKWIYKEHSDWVNSVAFNPAGNLLASSSYDQTIKFWDIDTGQCVSTLKEHTDAVSSVAFSPDGQTLASCSHDHTVKLWDTKTLLCHKTLQGHTKWVLSVAFSPDGQTLASCSRDQTVKLWNIHSERCLNTLEGHSDEVLTVAFSPNDDVIASGSFDQTVKLWNTQSAQCLTTLQGHTDLVSSVTLSSDGQSLASSSYDQTIKIWDIQSERCLHTLEGHSNEVLTVAFSPDDQTIASGGFDKTVKLWDTGSGQCTKTLKGYSGGVGSIAFNSDGQILAGIYNTQSIKLWNTNSGYCIKTFSGHTRSIWSVAFDSKRQILASGSSDQTVKIWDIHSGHCLRTLQGHSNEVRSVAFGSDSKILASGSTDQTIKLWNIDTGQCIKTFKGDINEIWMIDFSPDGHTIAAACQDVKVWDTNSGICIKTLNNHNSSVFSVAFSPDSQVLASSGNDYTVRLFDVRSGECFRTLQGHSAGVWSAIFSPNGQILASGSSDKTIKLWQVSTGQCLSTIEGHLTGVWGLAFSPNSQILAAYSQDETIKLWDVKTGKYLKTLIDKPYKGMNITGVTGLAKTEIESLKILGAFGEE